MMALPIRVAPCACGRHLIQRPGESMEEVVRAHNETPEHRAYRQRLMEAT